MAWGRGLVSREQPVEERSGNVYGTIGTSIAGTRHVSPGPLFGRYHLLAKVEDHRAELLARLDALPAHPRGASRTT